MFVEIVIALSIISLILGLIATYFAKKRMSKSLGRKATEHDLSSINSWMQVTDEEEKVRSQSKDSENRQ
ncbi:hypothetical protein BH20ACI4_BH20ACI4_15700 [soil metagenome]